jgi:hypothetical protein
MTIDECHLAENATLTQRTNESVANADFDGSAFHDKELYRRIALAEDNVPRFEAANRTSRLNQKIKVNVCIRHSPFPTWVVSIS